MLGNYLEYKLYLQAILYIFTTGIYNPTLGPASRHSNLLTRVGKRPWLLWTLSFRAKRDASKKGPASWSLSGGAPSWRTAAWQQLVWNVIFCTSVKSVYPKDRKDPPMEWFEPVWRRGRVLKIASFEGPMILRVYVFCRVDFLLMLDTSYLKYHECNHHFKSYHLPKWKSFVEHIPLGSQRPFKE